MEYTIRNNVLPSYYQVGYYNIQNGVSVGVKTSLPSQAIGALHYHRCLELGICCSGSGETHIENRVYRFTSGDIQYIGANVPHLSTADPDSDCSWIWIFVDTVRLFTNEESRLVDTMLKISDSAFNGVFHPEEHPQLASLIRYFCDRSGDDKFGFLENSFLAGLIMIESARIGNTDKREKLKIASRIKPALRYIQNNYMYPQLMSADKIASNCSLSTSHFRALFRDNIGMTLPQFVQKTRLSAAVYLLQNTNDSVHSIAESCDSMKSSPKAADSMKFRISTGFSRANSEYRLCK